MVKTKKQRKYIKKRNNTRKTKHNTKITKKTDKYKIQNKNHKKQRGGRVCRYMKEETPENIYGKLLCTFIYDGSESEIEKQLIRYSVILNLILNNKTYTVLTHLRKKIKYKQCRSKNIPYIETSINDIKRLNEEIAELDSVIIENSEQYSNIIDELFLKDNDINEIQIFLLNQLNSSSNKYDFSKGLIIFMYRYLLENKNNIEYEKMLQLVAQTIQEDGISSFNLEHNLEHFTPT